MIRRDGQLELTGIDAARQQAELAPTKSARTRMLNQLETTTK